MRVRRALLVCALGLVSASAFGASDPAVDVQAGPYGGTADGKWTCGPRGSVKYGGGAGQVKIDLAAERTPFLPKRTGLNVDLKGAIEHRSYTLECTDTGGRCPGPDGTYRAGSATIGFDGKWIGGNFGIMAYSKVSQGGQRKALVLPEFRLRGPVIADTTRLELGFGSPTLFSVMRPGLYGGATVGGERRDLTVTMGAMRTFEDTYTLRTEAQFRAALGSAAWLGIAGAFQAYKQGRGEIGGVVGFRAF